MKRNCIVRLSFIMACFFAGCGLGDPERVDGDPCGGEGIEFLGTLGNGLSEISPPSAAQLGWELDKLLETTLRAMAECEEEIAAAQGEF